MYSIIVDNVYYDDGCIQDEQTQVCGVVLVENMSDLGLVHAWNFDRRAAHLFTSLVQVVLSICLAQY